MPIPASVLATVGLLFACTPTFDRYPEISADQYSHFQVQEDLAIGANAITTVSEQERLLGVNFVKEGILPVYVKAENRSPIRSYIITTDKTSVYNDRGAINTSDSATSIPNKMEDTAGKLEFISLWFLQMRNEATAIRENMANRALVSTTLSPKESTEGFVFFNAPIDALSSKQWALHIEAQVQGSTRHLEFAIPLDVSVQGRSQ
jgi:hypothetical protein